MPRILPICQRLDCDHSADAAHVITIPVRYRDFTGGGPDPKWTQEFWYCVQHAPPRDAAWVPLFEVIGDVSR